MQNIKKPKQEIPEPIDLNIPPKSYQPTAKEQREETDMPGLSIDQIRRAFMRPFKVREKD